MFIYVIYADLDQRNRLTSMCVIFSLFFSKIFLKKISEKFVPGLNRRIKMQTAWVGYYVSHDFSHILETCLKRVCYDDNY